MNETKFPAVKAVSPSEALNALGIDEGTVLEYSPASGMYIASSVEEKDTEEGYSYFANAIGFSKSVVDALVEKGIVEIHEPEDGEPEQCDCQDKEPEQWETAELTIQCGRCYHEEKVVDAIGGTTLFMPTTSSSETRLVCSECGNRMTLVYRNGRDLTESEKEQLEKRREEEMAARQAQVAEQPDVETEAEPQIDNTDEQLQEEG